MNWLIGMKPLKLSVSDGGNGGKLFTDESDQDAISTTQVFIIITYQLLFLFNVLEVQKIISCKQE